MCLEYAAQLAWKQQRVAAHFSGHLALAGSSIDACVPSPANTGYRNQAKYVYGRAHASAEPVLGAFAPRSHRVVDLAGCCVVEPVLDEVRQILLGLLLAGNVAPFDEQHCQGDLRYVVMRATAAGEVMVTLVAGRPGWQDAREIATLLGEACPAVTSVMLNTNVGGGNVLLADEERVLCGAPFVEDRIGEVSVRLSSRSFAQVNRQVAARIYRDIVAAAPAQSGCAVDVYSGAAPIALSLATRAEEVIAMEENGAATAAAAAFIAEQGGVARRVRTLTGDAAVCLAQVTAADVVVLNPPRKGCAPEVLAATARLRPSLLAYLACDPATLARDVAKLEAAGARVLRVTPYDMMPHTPHVETLVLLATA
jgi:23S rRNA (uracil1939-C5)-methyltransferase